MTFEEWFKAQPKMNGIYWGDLEVAFLAGQASAAELDRTSTALITSLQTKIVELERERDELGHLFGVAFKQCEALKVQVGEPDYIKQIEREAKELSDYLIATESKEPFEPRINPSAEQAGEPIAYFDFQERGFYWANSTKIASVPVTVKIEPMALFTYPKPTTEKAQAGEPDPYKRVFGISSTTERRLPENHISLLRRARIFLNRLYPEINGVNARRSVIEWIEEFDELGVGLLPNAAPTPTNKGE